MDELRTLHVAKQTILEHWQQHQDTRQELQNGLIDLQRQVETGNKQLQEAIKTLTQLDVLRNWFGTAVETKGPSDTAAMIMELPVLGSYLQTLPAAVRAFLASELLHPEFLGRVESVDERLTEYARLCVEYM